MNTRAPDQHYQLHIFLQRRWEAFVDFVSEELTPLNSIEPYLEPYSEFTSDWAHIFDEDQPEPELVCDDEIGTNGVTSGRWRHTVTGEGRTLLLLDRSFVNDPHMPSSYGGRDQD